MELAADAAAVRALIGPWCEVTELDTGRCRVEITADSLQWAAFAVGVTGAEITACDSAELIALLRDWSERFARVGALPS